ncbi:MAG: hypothetical protein OM95_07985 [Bdellovibrio sp. ArHS]|uniref:hypothetical protein n=1 Tax=Bdellovibrio sp. ArHS TaxID=1569284 RepID=UPI0005827743|nr:hypothetical protein [Bdellovibrio sp. ArHS]KHD88725.1 MAG: hypothetical protein OM95_07985 [Bdellovibrio sp. ArHS]
MKLIALIVVALLLCKNGFAASSCLEDCDELLYIPFTTESWRQSEYNKCVAECPKDDQASVPFGLMPELPPPTDQETPGLIPESSSYNAKDNDMTTDGTSSSGIHGETTSTCTENFDAEISVCESATLKAQSSCDESGSLNDKLSNLASTTAILGGQKSAMGIQESCTKMASYMKGANAALMAYRQLCNGGIAACVSACSASLTPRCKSGTASASVLGEAREAMTGNLGSCRAFSSKMAEANAALQNYALIQSNAQSCAMLTTGTGTTPEICKNDPSFPGCSAQEKMDCSNPVMASNKVCICSKTPNDPVCRLGQVAHEDVKPLPSTDRRSPISQSGHIVDGDALSARQRMPANTGRSDYSADMVDGMQGGGASLALPNLRPGLQKRLKDKKIPDSPVLGGFYESGRTPKEKHYEKLNLDQNGKSVEKIKAANSGLQDSPDLRKFLPKAFSPKMPIGLAGSADEAGIDGITGPHSNIWKKVQNRYEALKESLLP